MVFWARVSHAERQCTAPLTLPRPSAPTPGASSTVGKGALPSGARAQRWAEMESARQEEGQLQLPQNHRAGFGELSSATRLPRVTGPEHRLSLPPRRLSGCEPYEAGALLSIHQMARVFNSY